MPNTKSKKSHTIDKKMEKAYLQALSVVVGAELRYVAIITTNARYLDTTTNTSISIPDTPTPTAAGHSKKSHASEEEPHPTAAIKAELARPYYLCIGKHSFCILDREMSGNSAHVVGGYLIKVPFRGILQVRTCGSNKDAVSIDIQPNQAVVPCGCTLPPSIYIRSGSSDRIVQQLRICWKADNMYRTLSVKDLLVQKKPNLLIQVEGKYSKRRRSNVAVIIDRIVFISSFLFYCLLLNHSFQTNPNRITNCFELFSLSQLYNNLQLHCSCVAILIFS